MNPSMKCDRLSLEIGVYVFDSSIGFFMNDRSSEIPLFSLGFRENMCITLINCIGFVHEPNNEM